MPTPANLMKASALALAAMGWVQDAAAQDGTNGNALQANTTQCIRRETDDRPSIRGDDKAISIWVSVKQPTRTLLSADIAARGTRFGKVRLKLYLDGVPVGRSSETAESKGTGVLTAHASAPVDLTPGQQHKLTAKPEAQGKELLKLQFQVGLGGGC
ncbi:hypothetical protein [Novosphingobium sp. SCN 63-17]|nr:hypothetical protein [Novosphingobium sp. SCN 63-17]MDR6706036.1 hypothetical protein [Novosphingobium sp. 1748]